MLYHGRFTIHRTTYFHLNSRDRLAFSKSILRRFIRECVTRDAAIASPWVVKPALSLRYGLETEMPREYSLIMFVLWVASLGLFYGRGMSLSETESGLRFLLLVESFEQCFYKLLCFLDCLDHRVLTNIINCSCNAKEHGAHEGRRVGETQKSLGGERRSRSAVEKG